MMIQDVRFALRSLRRRPVFAAIAITTMALGSGAATSIYSVVDGVLLRPLPFRDPERLVAIWETSPEWRKNDVLNRSWDNIPLSLPEYRDIADQSTSFDHVAVWHERPMRLAGGDNEERVRALRASRSLLAVLGVRPMLGRTFLAEEERPNGARVAMVSFEAWQARFGGDQDILGRAVKLDDTAYSVVGVLPPRLDLGRTSPIRGLGGGREFWIPAGQDFNDYHQRAQRSFSALGRLKPGVTIGRASADVDRILRLPHERASKGTRVAPWHADQTREVRGPLYVLLAAVGLLLVIACVNIATLLLGEAGNREHEMAARLAIGATRTRLVRQLLNECLALAAIGGGLGVILAWWGTKLLVALAPSRIPGLTDVHVDGRVLAFAVVLTFVTAALFGTVPAIVLSSTRPGVVLRSGTGQSARGRGAVQRVLIATEIALSVVLLVGAGLLARTLERLARVDPGFRADHLLVLTPSLPRSMLRDTLATSRFLEATLARLDALPGVVAVTAGSEPPFIGGMSSSSFRLEGEPTQAPGASVAPTGTRRHQAQLRWTVPGYFSTLGIPLRAGRDFTTTDEHSQDKVAIVSEALAKRDFPGASPLGKRILYQRAWHTIVGVVGDVHFARLSRDVEATLYTPPTRTSSVSFLVRTVADPATLADPVRAAVRELEPRAIVSSVEMMEEAVKRSFAEERYRALLISVFGAIAALLAAVGMYGVTSRSVARRTREVAIRIALGATQGSIVRKVVGTTLGGVAIGVTLGLLGAAGVARLLRPYLFHVRPTDPPTYITIVALLAAVALGASWLPARRAGKIPLSMVLRVD